MIPQGIDASQGPPYRVPLGFFSIAGIFFIAGGILMTLWNESLWIHRKSFAVYGVLHATTLGVFAFTMFGALFQMLPVIAGTPVKVKENSLRAVRLIFAFAVSAFIYSLLSASSAMLTAVTGGITVILSFHFAYVFLKNLFSRTRGSGGPSAAAFEYSLMSFSAGLVFAFLLVISHGGAEFLTSVHSALSDSHVSLMLFGWAGILVTGVCLQIVPMFFTAPEYPSHIKKYLPFLMFLGILIHVFFLLTGSAFSLPGFMITVSGLFIFLLFSYFTFFTFYILYKRKRKVHDRSLVLFRTAFVSLIVSLLFSGVSRTASHFPLHPDSVSLIAASEIAAGVFFLYGFLAGMINGMILKIVPFLSWFHLVSSGKMVMTPMSGFLHEKSADLLPWWHILTLTVMAMTAAAGFYTPGQMFYAAVASGILYTGNGILFLMIVLYGIHQYRRHI